uniref:Uncharacterized protein n=1 Tax=Leptobrachium leishanense TaxID=445787 RepID=A0A8C5Q991_9ANUR
MAKVQILNVMFEVTFECIEDLSDDLDEEYDQVLDSVLVGPMPAGRHMFCVWFAFGVSFFCKKRNPFPGCLFFF